MSSVTTAPDEARARYVAGLTQLGSGQAEAAIDTLRHVLTLDPTHTGARRNLIRALTAVRDHTAIIDETAHALRDAPESAELHFLRGTAFNALSRPLLAREALTAAVRLNPAFAPGWLNLGNALMDLDDLPAAEAHCRHALGLDPGLIEAKVSLGFILTSQGRLAEAITVLEAAIQTHPGNVHAHWNLATAALLSGDLPRGFAEYEWRKRHDRFRRDFINLPGPIWDGGDPRGRTILVHAEQGLGDTVQFARYLTVILQHGGNPLLACEPSLIPLLKSIAGVEIISKYEPMPKYDAWIDQMSLPQAFGTSLETIPSPAGYLSADPALIATHRATLPPWRCIGLAWSGNPLHRNDRRRTPPAELFAPFAALPDTHVISLVPDRTQPGIAAPARPLSDYAETAALVAALDLVVTVDTSVAHVAGALRRPAWVLLPYAPDWRWLLHRNDTPWYDSIRLVRQPSPGDWHSVIVSVIAALAG
jgi:cytochrome c-type biogenesis protein CcmH/NrfG